MKTLTNKQIEKLKRNGQPENREKDHKPVVKLFLIGTGFTWLLTEIYPQAPDIAFGLCDLNVGFPEIGDVSLSELTDLTVAGIYRVERDLHFKAKFPLSVYTRAAYYQGFITEDEEILQRFVKTI